MCTVLASDREIGVLEKGLKGRLRKHGGGSFLCYKIVQVTNDVKASKAVFSQFGPQLGLTKYPVNRIVSAEFNDGGRTYMPFHKGIHAFLNLKDAIYYFAAYNDNEELRVATFEAKKKDVLHMASINSGGFCVKRIPCLLLDKVKYTGRIARRCK